MRADTQRRDPRAPLGVLVELTHEDFDEPFEADGVDVGLGGLGMRAAFLPDVGSRLTCRFDAPDGTGRVEAPCEVVWARDSGPHVGQVGLRFTHLEGAARQLIRHMVKGAETGGADDAPEPAAPRRHVVEPCLEEPETPADPHAQVQLYLDGVEAAIPARVVARHDEGLRVVQKLGLFRLGTGVEVQNGERRRGRIEAVSIRAGEPVPELVLDVAYEAAPAASAPGPEESEASAGEGAELGPDTLPDWPAPQAPPPLPAQAPAPPPDESLQADPAAVPEDPVPAPPPDESLQADPAAVPE
ncbi:MAG: PilZ domain-containing protein, partial [Myxococcota bacterium]